MVYGSFQSSHQDTQVEDVLNELWMRDFICIGNDVMSLGLGEEGLINFYGT